MFNVLVAKCTLIRMPWSQTKPLDKKAVHPAAELSTGCDMYNIVCIECYHHHSTGVTAGNFARGGREWTHCAGPWTASDGRGSSCHESCHGNELVIFAPE